MFRWNEWAFTRPACDTSPPVIGAAPYPWWMDRRHVELIYSLAMGCGLRRAVEIGARRGSSSAALVQALVDGGLDALTVAEPVGLPELEEVLDLAGGKCRWHRGPGVEVISSQTDFLVWDGDHNVAPVLEEWAAVQRCKVPLWVLHDVRADWIPGCEGPSIVLEQAVAGGDYRVWVDVERREGEWTDRGLAVGCRLPEKFGFVGLMFEWMLHPLFERGQGG